MKIQWLVLSLAGLWPSCALAQTSTPVSSSAPSTQSLPRLSVEPAAQVILERATQNYKKLDGIKYTTEWRAYTSSARKGKGLGPAKLVFTSYSRPDKWSLSYKGWWSPSIRMQAVSDGADLYTAQLENRYYKTPTSPAKIKDYFGATTTTGDLVGAMLVGDNPFAWVEARYADRTSIERGRVIALGSRVIDGDVLQGVQYTFSGDETSVFDENEVIHIKTEVTAWFGGSPFLLRRVQLHTAERWGNQKGWRTSIEKVTEQQLNPNFEPGTFQWNDTGLTLSTPEADAAERAKEEALEKEQQKQRQGKPYWDSRLKVGAAPFAFSATDLQGHTITPKKYKGKVLLLDFWATWCVPCVIGLPELKAAYDKYHAQGLEVVSISADTKKQALISFIQEHKLVWPQIYDQKGGQSQVADKYDIQAIPFLLLIGKDGKIAAVNPRGEIDKAVKAALAKK